MLNIKNMEVGMVYNTEVLGRCRLSVCPVCGKVNATDKGASPSWAWVAFPRLMGQALTD